MDTRVLISTKELLELAKARVEFPTQPILVSYDEETDSLFLKFSESKSVISQTSKKDDGIVFDFDSQKHLVSIEIFDLCNN